MQAQFAMRTGWRWWRGIALCGLGLLWALPVCGQGATNQPGMALERVVRERAEKIVAPLALADTNLAARVIELVAGQYLKLAAVHAVRDAARAESGGAQTASPAGVNAAASEVELRQRQLHREFLAALAAELTSEQVDKIKDGMTYGVAPLTYSVYCRMFPELTDEQRRQVLAWLHEARELAMVAGTAREKHAVFGKYKGRINNYLVKAGHDLKAGERNLRDSAPTGATTNTLIR